MTTGGRLALEVTHSDDAAPSGGFSRLSRTSSIAKPDSSGLDPAIHRAKRRNDDHGWPGLRPAMTTGRIEVG
jgi:hypothetical protein